MNFKQIFYTFLTIDFLALTGYAVYDLGLMGILDTVTASSVTVLLTVDLLIALGVATGWMIADARKLGLNFWPYIIITLGTGSAGPLIYLIVRESKLDRKADTTHAAAAAAALPHAATR